MNKAVVISITSVIAVCGLFVAVNAKWKSLIKDLEERYPDIDPKIIRKAYKNMMINSLHGEYVNINDFNALQMDLLFMEEVQKLTEK